MMLFPLFYFCLFPGPSGKMEEDRFHTDERGLWSGLALSQQLANPLFDECPRADWGVNALPTQLPSGWFA